MDTCKRKTLVIAAPFVRATTVQRTDPRKVLPNMLSLRKTGILLKSLFKNLQKCDNSHNTNHAHFENSYSMFVLIKP